MKSLIISLLILTLTACVQTQGEKKGPGSSTNIDSIQNQQATMSDYSPTFEKAHPNAKRLMNEEFYFSPIEESGPFGSDDGADAYAGFKDWRPLHKHKNLMEYLKEQIDYWGYPVFDINETDLEKLKPYLRQSDLASRYMSGIDAAIVAIAFGQLYLEGTIDTDFREIVKTSINRQLIPELLALWGDTYKAQREAQLRKMLEIINQID